MNDETIIDKVMKSCVGNQIGIEELADIIYKGKFKEGQIISFKEGYEQGKSDVIKIIEKNRAYFPPFLISALIEQCLTLQPQTKEQEQDK